MIAMDKDGQLYSKLLTSSPLVVHLDLQNFKVTLEIAEVCPRLITIVSYQGCYACATMAVIRFKALSTCLPGTASVSFQKIQQYTPGIILMQTEVEYAIQISTEYKCISDSLCLASGIHKSCESIEFCLEEPVIKLYQGNVSSVFVKPDSVSGMELGFGGWLSNFFSFSWLGKGAIFAIIGVVILFPIISCAITFCKRS